MSDARPPASSVRPAPDTPLADVPGMTAAQLEAFSRLGLSTVESLLRCAPRRYEDRRHPTPIADLDDARPHLILARVARSASRCTKQGLHMLEVDLADDSGVARATWFQRGWARRGPAAGALVYVYGKAAWERGGWSFRSPDMETKPDGAAREGPHVDRLVPVHPLARGITAPQMRSWIWRLLPVADAVPEMLAPALRERFQLAPLAHALRNLHFPSDRPAGEAARKRLAFDELLVHSWALAERRRATRRLAGPPLAVSSAVDRRIRSRLPFQPTPGQEGAIADIAQDLAAGPPMQRLLQGDVGCGKTAVAAYALLAAVAAGWQGALLAPTEILARQHEHTLRTWLHGSRVRIVGLAGGLAPAERRERLAAVAAGHADLVVGTHALLQDDVAFARLGLVVVDEQHRFGVEQRAVLSQKGLPGTPPHLLLMSATPMPRTMALAVYGDLDASTIEDRVPGRQTVETWVVAPREAPRIMNRVRAALAAGQQVYAIYPLVEESEASALRDATRGAARWQKALPGARVGLLTGRLPPAEKQATMSAFREGALDVLVSTVVVEVGMDVPRATVLVVEHAERFGLVTLHQLRGRIGRGSEGGLCVLVDRSPKGARPARLEVLEATHDGFVVAEEDLALRGIGDLFGTRQHGRPPFRAARLPRDLSLLEQAREAAGALGQGDPSLLAAALPAALSRAAGPWIAGPRAG